MTSGAVSEWSVYLPTFDEASFSDLPWIVYAFSRLRKLRLAFDLTPDHSFDAKRLPQTIQTLILSDPTTVSYFGDYMMDLGALFHQLTSLEMVVDDSIQKLPRMFPSTLTSMDITYIAAKNRSPFPECFLPSLLPRNLQSYALNTTSYPMDACIHSPSWPESLQTLIFSICVGMPMDLFFKSLNRSLTSLTLLTILPYSSDKGDTFETFAIDAKSYKKPPSLDLPPSLTLLNLCETFNMTLVDGWYYGLPRGLYEYLSRGRDFTISLKTL